MSLAYATWSGLACLALLVAPVAGAAGDDAGAAALQPLLDRPLPDPYVFEDGGMYVITGTAPYGYCGPKLEPGSLKPFDLSIDYGELGGPFQHWGFKIYRHTDGTYHGFATVHFGHFVTAVAHLKPAPGQRWEPGKPITAWAVDTLLAGDREGTNGFAYDMELLHDTDGSMYLVYNHSEGRHRNVHLMAMRMLDPSTPDPTFTPRPILSPEGFRSEDRNPGYIQIVEATNIVRVQGMYVLLYSVGDFVLYDGRSNYKLGVAFSDTLIPPPGQTYTKVLVPDPANLWGNTGKGGLEVCYLLQSQHPEWPNYSGDCVVGPGLGNIVETERGYRLVFHGYRPGAKRAGAHERFTWELPLSLRIGPDRPVHEWIMPLLPPGRVPPVAVP